MVKRRVVVKFIGLGFGVVSATLGSLYHSILSARTPLVHPLGKAGPDTGVKLPPTLQCDGGLSTRQTEGPLYAADTPHRRDLREPECHGTNLILSGRVLDTDCRPIAGAVLDFWHTDGGGDYDDLGFGLRGHQFTDDQGTYHLTTFRPGAYRGRTPHIHVKVQGANTRLLTTQLYFPDLPDANRRDGGYEPSLLVSLCEVNGEAVRARFDFVLAKSR